MTIRLRKREVGKSDTPDYPYLPKGRTLKFVPLSNKWMQAARKVADTKTGCSWWPTAAVVVKNGKIIGKSANNSGIIAFPCPRIEQKCKTGEGYNLCNKACDVHEHSHAENKALEDALAKGNDPKGADLYLFGHWWCCEECWDDMIKAGIHDVYLLQDAHTVFTRENRTKAMEKLMNSSDTENLSANDVAWEV